MTVRFNYDLLKEICENNNLTLLYDYSDKNLNCKSRIEGICKNENCKNIFSVQLASLLKNEGICIKCSKNQNKVFTYSVLKQICDDNNITLLADYSNVELKNFTIIKGDCISNNCEREFSRGFYHFLNEKNYKCVKCNSPSSKKNSATLKKMREENIIFLEDYSDMHIVQGTVIKGICAMENCDKEFERIFGTLVEFGPQCTDCARTKGNIKRANTNIDKYGSECALQSEGVIKKANETKMEKYGSIYPINSEEIKKKTIETNMKRYGTANPSQNKDIREKIRKTHNIKYGCDFPQQNAEIRQKTKDTFLGRFGTAHPLQNEMVKEKTKKTNNERYGCDWVLQNEDIKTKITDTTMERYGVKHTLQVPEIKERIANTNIEKYGYKHPMQNAEISERSQKNSYKLKEYVFPSGKTIKCQGYEPFALDQLIKNELIKEEDIVTSRTEVPEIWYTNIGGIKKRYYMDIYIVSQKRCIEVKSDWTIGIIKDNIFLKHEAVKKYGHASEIWVYNGKGNIIEKYD